MMERAVKWRRGGAGSERFGPVARRAAGVLLLVVVVPLVGAACGGREDPEDVLAPATAAVEIRPGETFTLAVGETATVPRAGISVHLSAIPSDSRCPIDVTCVWAGDVAVALRVAVGDGAPETLELHHPTDVMGPVGVAIDGHWLEIIGVEPAPRSDRTIPQADYRARFRLDERAG